MTRYPRSGRTPETKTMTANNQSADLPTILIKEATLVNENTVSPGDILIRQGRIERIDEHISAQSGWQVIDASGLTAMPGMIDDQVHFREPGLTVKADLKTESRAAVAGGITSFMEMPNTTPPTTNAQALETKFNLAAEKALANYSFYLGGTNDNLEDIKRLNPRSACGIKVFMGASTGNMLVDNPETLDGIFEHAPTLIATHCEDTPTVLRNLEQARAQYGDDIPVEAHPVIRSHEACYKSTELAIGLARKHGTKLHVLHLSTAAELDFFEPGPMEAKQITAEACVHFLMFDETDYAALGNQIKCNPAIKSPDDRKALLAGLRDGRLDILATDHAPHLMTEKERPYMAAPAGLPLVQHAVPIIMEQVHRGELTLELAVEKMAHNPARRFDVLERGFLREGYWADIVLVDRQTPLEVNNDQMYYKCGWTPFAGMSFSSTVVATIVSGFPAWLDGKLNLARRGLRLEFDR